MTAKERWTLARLVHLYEITHDERKDMLGLMLRRLHLATRF